MALLDLLPGGGAFTRKGRGSTGAALIELMSAAGITASFDAAGNLCVVSAAPGSTATTILNTASLSGIVDLGEQRLHRVAMGAAWTAAAMTFQVSADGVTFNDLYNEAGEYALTSSVVGASRSIVVDQAIFYGIRYLKVRSGTGAAAVNQGADRTLTLVTVPR